MQTSLKGLRPGSGGRCSTEELSLCDTRQLVPAVCSRPLGWGCRIWLLNAVCEHISAGFSPWETSMEAEGSLLSEFPGKQALSCSTSLLCATWLTLCLWQGSSGSDACCTPTQVGRVLLSLLELL